MQAVQNYLIRATHYWSQFSPRTETPKTWWDGAMTFYGLFDSRHKWAADYMLDVEDDELRYLQMSFDLRMLELGRGEQLLVIDTVSRRYVAQIDDAIERLGLDAKSRDVENAKARVAAREYAMEQDWDRVDTMRKVVENAIARTNVRITELQAEIQVLGADVLTAGVEKELVEADVLQKELEAAKAELELQRSVLRALQIQQEIAETGLEISRTHTRVSELRADKVQWEVRIAENSAQIAELDAQIKRLQTSYAQVEARETGLEAEQKESEFRRDEIAIRITELQAQREVIAAEIRSIEARITSTDARIETMAVRHSEVDVDIAQIEADVKTIESNTARMDVDIARASIAGAEKLLAVAETDVEKHRAEDFWPKRRDAAKARVDVYQALLEDYKGLNDVEAGLRAALLAVTEQDFALREQSDTINHLLYALDASSNITVDRIASRGATLGKAAEITMAGEDKKLYGTKRYASDRRTDGAIAAADKMARATIVNRVKHMIGRAVEEGDG